VMFPALSRIQDDELKFRAAAGRMHTLVAALVMPVMAAGVVTAEPLVRLLYTAKWLPCVPYFQLLCIGGPFEALISLNHALLQARGRADFCFRSEILFKVLLIVSVSCGVLWGIRGLIIGRIASQIAMFLLLVSLAGRVADYGLRAQAADLLPIAAAAIGAGLAAWGVGRLCGEEWGIRLGVEIAVGAATYGGICHFTRIPALRDLWQVAREALLPAKAVPAGSVS